MICTRAVMHLHLRRLCAPVIHEKKANVMLALHPEYLVGGNLQRKAVALTMAEWELILEALEELDDIAFDPIMPKSANTAWGQCAEAGTR